MKDSLYRPILSLQNTEAGEPYTPESARLISCILIKATAATVEVVTAAAEVAEIAAATLVAVTEVMDEEIEWSLLLPLPLAQPRKPPINGDR